MSKVEVHQEIFVTNSYEIFKNIKGNRSLRQNNLNKIMESMKEKQLIIPICVNDKMEIIDGQHRYSSCRELRLPVYYYIQPGYNIEDVERANRANTNWFLTDFLASYSSKGIFTYIELSAIVDKYGLSIAELLKVLSKFKKSNMLDVTESFKNETLIIKDADLDKVITFLECLRTFQNFPEYKNSRFISAYLQLYMHPKYKHELLIAKYKILSSKLVNCGTIEDYLSILANQIYSAKKATKDNIYYNKERKHLYN